MRDGHADGGTDRGTGGANAGMDGDDQYDGSYFDEELDRLNKLNQILR